jgi:hypothetical protein
VRIAAAAAVAALAGLAAPAGASPAAARVVRCHAHADFNIVISSARNMTCHAAAREMRRYKGSIRTRFRTPGGFGCYRVSGNPLAGQWRCVRRAQAYRFEFSD